MIGTYVLMLECTGNGQTATADEVPYPNLATPVINTYDLSNIVPAIQGIAYDAMGSRSQAEIRRIHSRSEQSGHLSDRHLRQRFV
jgi:hypothetical protein